MNIVEPRKDYLNYFEKEHRKNSEEYFNELVKQAGINQDKSNEIDKKIASADDEIKIAQGELKKAKKGNHLSRLGIVLSIISGALLLLCLVGYLVSDDIVALFSSDSKPNTFVSVLLLILSILGLAGGIVLVSIFSSKVKKEQNAASLKLRNAENIKKDIEKQGYQLLAPLNNLYDFNICETIVKKTCDIIQIDPMIDQYKLELLMNKYKWTGSKEENTSTIYLKTGQIGHNPFLIYRTKSQTMVNHTYTGSITITWTERVSDGRGGYNYVTRTQTLTASVTEPKPVYSYQTKIIYGNEAAPDLIFSRHPMVHQYDENSLKRLFKQREKEVDKLIKSKRSFTPIGNDEFEDYFDGTNRNHEVQYRVLFTPLAQRAILDIITHPTPYGDDFSFYKNKMLNTVISGHSQNADYDGDPRLFADCSLARARQKFVDYNVKYFQNIYFDLAPLLAIPIYQTYDPEEYIFKHNRQGHYSSHLGEMLANRYYDHFFAPEDADTELILKADYQNYEDNCSYLKINAHAFQAIEQVSYFNKLGGDGRMHTIPVHWYRYEPLVKESPFIVQETSLNKKDFETIAKEDKYQEIYKNSVQGDGFWFNKGCFTFINKNEQYSPLELNNLIKERLNK